MIGWFEPNSNGYPTGIWNLSAANGVQSAAWDRNGDADQRWIFTGRSIQALGECLDGPINGTRS